MSYFDEKEIIEVPLDRIDKDGQSSTKYCFTEMAARLRITIAEAAKKYNDVFPEETTSLPNLANKLRRGGLKDYELARYAHALGYKLVLIPKEHNPKAATVDSNMTVDKLIEEDIDIDIGYTDYHKVVVIGRNASQIINLIDMMIEYHRGDLWFDNKADELSFFDGLAKTFDVIIKVTDRKE